MANQACISIGIDRYQFLPPLGYGMADATAMERFFIDAAGWNPSQCLLLTDTSTRIGDKSTYPDRENINRWIKFWSWDNLHAGDLLWFFFSGHGVSFGGEDYLVPIDGNPEDLANTCISIRQLYRQFHDIGVNALVFLDANRAQNPSSGGGIGKNTALIAQEYQIPTFLSCQEHEFSHEDSQLGHGLFTTALLEALNYHPDLNLETIDTYLTSRLAELSEHHWKPLQTPQAIVPIGISTYRPVFSATTINSIESMVPEVVYTPPTPLQPAQQDDYAPYIPPNVLVVVPEAVGYGAIVKRQRLVPTPKQVPHWAKISLLLTMMVCAGGGIYALQSQTKSDRSTPPKIEPSVNNLGDPIAVSQVSSSTPFSLSQAQALVKPGDATSRYLAILAARKIPANTPAAIEAQQSIEQWSQEIYQIAQGYANKQLWRLAIDTAKMVPPQSTNYGSVRASMSEWKGKMVK